MVRELKSLLIIGSGGHGRVVAETAEACGYTQINFIDDNSEIAIGKIADLKKLTDEYKEVFVGIGNNRFRAQLIDKLIELGYTVPVLIHPTAYVSKSAVIHIGTIVELKAIINVNAYIGRGCIVSVGSIIDHDARIGKASHVNAGAIVKAGGSVNDFVKLEAGEIVLDYKEAVVNKEQTGNE